MKKYKIEKEGILQAIIVANSVDEITGYDDCEIEEILTINQEVQNGL